MFLFAPSTNLCNFPAFVSFPLPVYNKQLANMTESVSAAAVVLMTDRRQLHSTVHSPLTTLIASFSLSLTVSDSDVAQGP